MPCPGRPAITVASTSITDSLELGVDDDAAPDSLPVRIGPAKLDQEHTHARTHARPENTNITCRMVRRRAHAVLRSIAKQHHQYQASKVPRPLSVLTHTTYRVIPVAIFPLSCAPATRREIPRVSSIRGPPSTWPMSTHPTPPPFAARERSGKNQGSTGVPPGNPPPTSLVPLGQLALSAADIPLPVFPHCPGVQIPSSNTRCEH